MRKTKNGFTLIELLVVVLIIGILAAVALPQYEKSVEKARAAEAISNIGSFAKALDLYALAHPNSDGRGFTGSSKGVGMLDIDYPQDWVHNSTGKTGHWESADNKSCSKYFCYTVVFQAGTQKKITASRANSSSYKYHITCDSWHIQNGNPWCFCNAVTAKDEAFCKSFPDMGFYSSL